MKKPRPKARPTVTVPLFADEGARATLLGFDRLNQDELAH